MSYPVRHRPDGLEEANQALYVASQVRHRPDGLEETVPRLQCL